MVNGLRERQMKKLNVLNIMHMIRTVKQTVYIIFINDKQKRVTTVANIQ